jgi:surfeit locus 1 family protein
VIERLLSLPSFIIGVVIYGLLSLGLWQLERAEEKQTITDRIILAQGLAPLSVSNPSNLLEKEYHHVLLEGHYLADSQFIYDNQIIKGNAGYFVLTPFVLNDHNSILINRGFVPWNGSRDNIANLEIGVQKRIIKVSLIKPVERIKLTESTTHDTFPILIQSINLNRLAALAKQDLIPIMGQLDKSATDGFFRQWKPFYGSVDKHLGYAFQWFLMAMALLIIALRLLIRK